mmetsp:Transcript_34648/g.107642  ORF Transcript_34648/g.107642 Transcript_34648/m.107642 type:complete len:209 (-) Transcript_34648:394-1020(-)
MPFVQSVDAAGARRAEHALQRVVLPQHLEHRLVVDRLPPGLEGARAPVLGILHVDQVEPLPSVFVVILDEPSGRVTCHRPNGPDRLPALGRRVAAAELGESLLQQHRVELVPVGLREDRPTSAVLLVGSLVARDEVVDDDLLPLLLYAVVEAQSVLAARVPLLGPEDGRDGALVLRQAGHRREQPTITQRALADVTAVDRVAEQLHLR